MEPEDLFNQIATAVSETVQAILPAVGVAAAVLVGLGLAWAFAKWGLPQLVGFFKRSAK